MRIARWTIGPVSKAGFECLSLSIASFQLHHPGAKIVVCHNCPRINLENIVSRFPQIELFDQAAYQDSQIAPMGVAWKLYPPRLFPDDHELCIDNDIVFVEPLKELEDFFEGNHTLLLEGSTRNYGRFERHVPQPYCINSGVYGMPPHFNFKKYLNFYVTSDWEQNAHGPHEASKTFDEQGIVALALLSYGRFVIIPEAILTNCERHLIHGKALHFVGLNRSQYHEPYRIFKSNFRKMFM